MNDSDKPILDYDQQRKNITLRLFDESIALWESRYKTKLKPIPFWRSSTEQECPFCLYYIDCDTCTINLMTEDLNCCDTFFYKVQKNAILEQWPEYRMYAAAMVGQLRALKQIYLKGETK